MTEAPANRPRWMDELDRRLLRRLQELEQENQQLRRDLSTTREKLDLVMNEGRRVLSARLQEVAQLKKEVNVLQEQLNKPLSDNSGEMRKKALPPRSHTLSGRTS